MAIKQRHLPRRRRILHVTGWDVFVHIHRQMSRVNVGVIRVLLLLELVLVFRHSRLSLLLHVFTFAFNHAVYSNSQRVVHKLLQQIFINEDIMVGLVVELGLT